MKHCGTASLGAAYAQARHAGFFMSFEQEEEFTVLSVQPAGNWRLLVLDPCQITMRDVSIQNKVSLSIPVLLILFFRTFI